MKERIRQWLGLDDITSRLSSIQCKLEGHSLLLNSTCDSVRAFGPGLGRILAKLDPMVSKSEFDPQRKEDSDKLGEDIIKRLKAEQEARDAMTGRIK